MNVPDPQQKRVYRWEKKWLYSKQDMMSIADLQTLADWACEYYGVDTVPVSNAPASAKTSDYWVDKRITLRKDHRNMLSILHEIAHHINREYHGWHDESHGANWLGIYVHLIVKSGFAPRVALEASLKHDGLQYRKSSVTPGALKKNGRYSLE